MKKFTTSLLLLFVIGFFCVNSALATSVDAQRSSDYLQRYEAWISADSQGKLTVNVKVDGKGTMTSIGAREIIIQESSDGEQTWNKVRTLNATSTNGMLFKNTNVYYSNPVTYSGTVGYSYRAIVTCYAANSSGSDSGTLTTAAVTARR